MTYPYITKDSNDKISREETETYIIEREYYWDSTMMCHMAIIDKKTDITLFEWDFYKSGTVCYFKDNNDTEIYYLEDGTVRDYPNKNKYPIKEEDSRGNIIRYETEDYISYFYHYDNNLLRRVVTYNNAGDMKEELYYPDGKVRYVKRYDNEEIFFDKD